MTSNAFVREDDSNPDGTCQYCGSLLPVEFMHRARLGTELEPTDKNYKVYLGDGRKFYFQHLDEAQREEFFQLFKTKKLTIGYPGHFYVLPFFIGRKAT